MNVNALVWPQAGAEAWIVFLTSPLFRERIRRTGKVVVSHVDPNGSIWLTNGHGPILQGQYFQAEKQAEQHLQSTDVPMNLAK